MENFMMPVKKLGSFCEAKRQILLLRQRQISLKSNKHKYLRKYYFIPEGFRLKMHFMFLAIILFFFFFSFKNAPSCLFKYLERSGVIVVKKKHKINFCLLIMKKKYLKKCSPLPIFCIDTNTHSDMK